MAKPTIVVPLTPHDVRVLNRLAEVVIGALESMDAPGRVRLAEALVTRIRNHYRLGHKQPWHSSSSPRARKSRDQ